MEHSFPTSQSNDAYIADHHGNPDKHLQAHIVARHYFDDIGSSRMGLHCAALVSGFGPRYLLGLDEC